MKITIDTKEDSPEDIRKIMSFLSNVIDRRESYISSPKSKNIFEDDSPGLNIFNPQPANNTETQSSNIFEDNSSSLPTYGEESPSVTTSSESQPANAFAAMFGSDSGQIPSSVTVGEEASQIIKKEQKNTDLDEISEDERKASKLVREY